MILASAVLAGLAVVVLLGLPNLDWRLPAPAAGVLLLPLGVPAAVAGALLAFTAARALAKRRLRAAEAAERAGAVEAIAVLSAELRAGRGTSEALLAAGQVADGEVARGLTAASRALHLDADPSTVLQAAADRSSAASALRGLAACLAVCSGSGASLASAVETVADGLRDEVDLRTAVATELAGPRATAMLLAGLPVAGIGLAAALGAHPVDVLLHSLVGGVCLVLGVLLEVLGLWWTDRLVLRASP